MRNGHSHRREHCLNGGVCMDGGVPGIMAEYIKRDTAIRAVMAAKWVDGSDGAMAMEIVASPPAADVAPVVHGWWNATETCSLCGEKSTEGLDATTWNYWLPNYCPHCGARMDGGEVDEP